MPTPGRLIQVRTPTQRDVTFATAAVRLGWIDNMQYGLAQNGEEYLLIRLLEDSHAGPEELVAWFKEKTKDG